jgi:CRISPR-associated protein (TIGR02584 family)
LPEKLTLKQPHEYPKRTLFAVIGMTPQIVTESLYVLATKQQPAFVPTDIKIVTTKAGAEQVKLNLLSETPGWFKRFCQDYELPDIQFTEDDVLVLKRPDGSVLDDIREPEDNELMADAITETIRELTSDKDRAVHVSIAGGRKTMGYYAGYALSLFGREQDRLSHVLVEKDFESIKEFYYTTPYSKTIQPGLMPLDTGKAKITLAEIPFVSLRDGLPEKLLKGIKSFSKTVQIAKQVLKPTDIVIDKNTRTLACAGQKIKLPPREFAFYLLFAKRKINNMPPVRWTDQIGNDYIEVCDEVYDYGSGHLETIKKTFKNPKSKEENEYIMEKDFFEQRVSAIRAKLSEAVGKNQVNQYFLNEVGSKPETRYQFAADSQDIHIK